MKKVVLIILIASSVLFCFSGCKGKAGLYNYNSTGFEKMPENTAKTFDTAVLKVDMDWVAGKINFVKGDKFSISEKALNCDYFPLYYKLEAGTLYIKWAESGTKLKYLADKEKEITVTVTSEFGAVVMNNVSAAFDIELYNADKIDIKNVSGKGLIKAGSVKEFEYDGVSGDLTVAASLAGSVKVNTVSGRTVINQKESAAGNSFHLNTVSGDIEIVFPADLPGYTLSATSVSGGYESAFGDKNYGDGSVSIDFNSVSAKIKITKGE